MIASAQTPRIKGRMRWRFGVCLTLIIFAALLLCWWLTKSARFSQVMLSEHAYCKVHFYYWRSGNCTLDFYRDGVRVGGTTLGRGLFTHPWAVFPGPAGQSVICFSWLDTTFAAFSVDLRQRPEQKDNSGVQVPPALAEAVNRSDFPVRACTPAEVLFVADLIARATPSSWASHLYVDEVAPDQEKQRCLSFLRLATTPGLWRDPSLHGAPPQILPADLP
jgi:hypothetical protein